MTNPDEPTPLQLAAFRSQFASTGFNWDSEPEVEGWEPWNVAVQVGRMPDGSLAIIGLRIEPRDDYEGSTRDQRISAVKLRSLPLSFLLSDAAAKNAVLRGDDYDEFNRLNTQAELAEGQHKIAEAVARRAAEVGRERALLEMTAVVYRNAIDFHRPRRASVAEALNVSLTTVDRYLAKARRDGILEPFGSDKELHLEGDHEPEPN